MNALKKVLDSLHKLADRSEKLVPLILSVAVLAAFVVIGIQGVMK
ncbi:hypothetical protein N7645_15115 [Pseudomonas juntendi]|nr:MULTISPECIES: hypothetical protein [Pseudomonas]MDG9918218.1 hypothetical protein [Pseudomonas juntendi]MDH0507666.1 hypothetical protein [Pseudomonas juntendi]MDH1044852.1 hypothetical protein [Pseudomonas juntendi]